MNRKVAIVVVLALVACVGIVGVLAGYFILAGRNLPANEAVAEDQPETPPATQTQSPAEPPPESLPPSLDAIQQMIIIESQVSDLRQLQPTGEVTRAFQTQEGLRQTLEETFAEEYSPEEARDDALVLASLRFSGA